jgi:hypothetical protein
VKGPHAGPAGEPILPISVQVVPKRARGGSFRR